jgi:ribosomal protein S18 acetylase RimI-like enzyme
MDQRIYLRPAVPEDDEFLFRVFSSTREREMAIVPWDAGQKETFLRSQFHAQKVHYEKYFPHAAHNIILRAEQPAGRLYVDRTGKDIHIVDIALLSEHRGVGIGTALLGDLLREARGSGKPVKIHVEKHNPAMRLYERLGFKIQSDAGIYFLMQWALNKELVNV